MKYKINILDLVLSLILALGFTCASRIHYTCFGGGNYVGDFGVSGIILAILIFIVMLFVIPRMHSVLDHVLEKLAMLEKPTGFNAPRITLFAILGVVLAYIPYYLSFYPGGIWFDTWLSIDYGENHIRSDRHPFFYNCFIEIVMKIGKLFGRDMNWVCGSLLFIQMLLLVLIVAYFFNWMVKYRLNRYIILFFYLICALLPIYPLYGVSVWKDTPFCIFMMFWVMSIYDLYYSLFCTENEIKKSSMLSNIVKFIIGSLGIAFLRNNGPYIVLSIILFFVFFLCYKKVSYRYSAILIILFLTICFIRGPIYDFLKVERTPLTEKYGILLQQICAVVVDEGNLTEEDKIRIDHIISREKIKEAFWNINVDSIKWNENFQNEYFEDHEREFLELWWDVFKKNPSICMKEYLIMTCYYWNPFAVVNENYAFVQLYPTENSYNIERIDYFNTIAGFSFADIVTPKRGMNAGILIWFYLIISIYLMKKRGLKSFCITLPLILCWISIMAATPIGVGYRYVSPLFFCLLPMLAITIIERRNEIP